MEFILWFAGVMATWTAFKFVFLVFKRLGSKNSMNDMLDRAEEKMTDAADNFARYVKTRKKMRKEKERPVCTIR